MPCHFFLFSTHFVPSCLCAFVPFFFTITSSITVLLNVTFGSCGSFASSTFSSRCTTCRVTSALTAFFTYPTCLPSHPRNPIPFFFSAIVRDLRTTYSLHVSRFTFQCPFSHVTTG